MGLKIADLEALSIGTVYDMITESGNDGFEYKDVATQDDFDRF